MTAALPTLRQLTYLIELARHGTFSRAAEAAFVTQPTLSAGIKELEDILGARLVERDPAGARLTPVGDEVVARAAKVIAEAQDLVVAARGAAEPLSGKFRLGAIPTVAPFLLPRALPALRAAYPNLKLYLREDLTSRLIDGLRARALDAALIALPYHAGGIETEALFDDEFVLLTPPGHPLAHRNRLTPADVAGEDLLLLEDGHCLRDHALSICSRTPLSGEAAPEIGATSLHTLVHMVAGGLGVSLLPKLAADAGVAAGADVVLTPFAAPVIGRSIGMAWRKGSARAEEARLIGEAVRRIVSAPA